jgi:DNA polymerase-1
MYILDAHSLIYQVFHAIPPMTGPLGQPTNAIFGLVGDVLRLRRRQPDYLVACFDAPGKNFRHELYAEYKAHRPPMPDDLAVQMPGLLRALDALRVPILQVPGVEADDVIATLARAAEARGLEVLICSSDKDLRQLLSDRIQLYNVRRDARFGPRELQADWGIRPDQVVDLLALTGDNVDNVPGVPGVGVKTAAKLLADYGSLAGILAALPTMKKGKLRDHLLAARDKLETSRQLVTLNCQVPLEMDWEGWRLQPLEGPKVLGFFSECGFHRYTAEIKKELATQVKSRKKTVHIAPGQRSLFDSLEEEAAVPTAEASGDGWRAHYQLVNQPQAFLDLLAELRQVSRFAIDLETTHLDPWHAEIVGVALCWEAGRAWYIALRGPAGQPVLGADFVLGQLRPMLEDPAIAKVNQNIKFDLLVLRHAGVRLAGVAGDPMIASYLLQANERSHNLDDLSLRHLGHQPIPIEALLGSGKHPRRMDEVDVAEVAQYAAEDADIAWRLCEKLEPALATQKLDALYRDLEVPLIEVLADMEDAGIKLDVELLHRLSSEFANELAALQNQIHELAGRPFSIDSPKQLREVLFTDLKLPPRRRTALTGDASTGQEVLEELAAAGHALPALVISYRQVAKLKGTYVDALPALVNPKSGRLHCSFNQTVAATGRLSSSDPNLQNIPARTDQGQQVRRAFIPGSPEQVLLTADYSQIELRVMAHLAEDEALMAAFQADQDIHSFVASQIFNVPESNVTKAQRRVAKTVNFGVFYGLSAYGLAKRLGISQKEATDFIDAYFAKYPGVARYQERVLAEARQHGYVATILGRRRAVFGIREKPSYRQRTQPEREALNTVVQGSAADLIKLAMLRIHRRLKAESLSGQMLLQIHDELVFEVRQDAVRELAQLVEHEMTHALDLRVPLKVDLAAGPNWLDVTPLGAG